MESVLAETAIYTDVTGTQYTIADIIRIKQQHKWKGVRESLTRVKTVGLPRQPRFPDTRFKDTNNYAEITAYARKLKLNVLKLSNRRLLPKVVPVTKNPLRGAKKTLKAIASTDSTGEMVQTVFPNGMPDLSAQTVVPRYRQPAVVIQGWSLMTTSLHQLGQYYVQNHMRQDALFVKDLLNMLLPINEGFVFGTGTRFGQLGRVQTGVQARDEMYHKAHGKPVYLTYANYTKFREAMNLVWKPRVNHRAKIRRPSKLLRTDGQSGHITDTKGNSLQQFHINGNSDSGFPWVSANLLKRETMFEDMAIAQQMLDQVDDVINGEMTADQFNKNWSWLSIVKLKRKAEVYTIEKYKTRSRNIYPVDSFANLILASVSAAFSGKKVNATNDTESESLEGFSPMSGGMQALMEAIWQRAQDMKTHLLFYADNLYLYRLTKRRGLVWVSIDAKQMEATHACDVARNLTRYLVERVNKVDPGGSTFEMIGGDYIDSAYANAAMYISENLVDCCTAVLETVQIEIPGIPSGIRTTFENNHAKTATLIHHLRTQPGDLTLQLLDEETGEPAPLLDTTFKAFGWPYKIEMVSADEDGIRNLSEKPYTTSRVGKEFKMDMLGFDAVQLKIRTTPKLNITVAVLAQDRLLKSMAFRKSRVTSRFQDLSQAEQYVQDFSTLAALYILGGWRPPYVYGFVATMVTISNQLRLQVKTFEKDRVINSAAENLREILQDQMQLSSDTSSTLAGKVGEWINGSLPSLADVIAVTNGREAAALVQQYLDSLPERHYLRGGEDVEQPTLSTQKRKRESDPDSPGPPPTKRAKTNDTTPTATWKQ